MHGLFGTFTEFHTFMMFLSKNRNFPRSAYEQYLYIKIFDFSSIIIEQGHEVSIVDISMHLIHVIVSHLLSHLIKTFELKLDRIKTSGDQEGRFRVFKGSVVIISLKHGVFLRIWLDRSI